jgi:hypothetical protein
MYDKNIAGALQQINRWSKYFVTHTSAFASNVDICMTKNVRVTPRELPSRAGLNTTVDPAEKTFSHIYIGIDIIGSGVIHIISI